MTWLTAEQFDSLLPEKVEILSDEPEMESSLHYLQLQILVTTLEWLWRDRNDFFIGANLTVYYSRQQLKKRDFKGPDFFLVKQTTKHPRTSWVVWEEEGKYPNVIIELLSDSTAAVDRGSKKELYQSRFQTPEYFWFSPMTQEFEGFRLVNREYGAIAPNEQGWRWSEELGLYLGVWVGRLRYFTASGELVPTPEEAAEQEIERAEQEFQRAEQEAQRADREFQRAEALAAQLRALGMEPEKTSENS
ncbi:MAG: Uma2 family endonuclease [Oculatellaceae cyanobacterium Prado106]|jgi:Uma2 family endonuclease|nr:Uma2 family endonuclease [Oculatellaceae cyanobacterium Prado106]